MGDAAAIGFLGEREFKSCLMYTCNINSRYIREKVTQNYNKIVRGKYTLGLREKKNVSKNSEV